MLGAICVALFLMRTVAQTPWELIAYGRSVLTQKDKGKMLFMGEGMNSSVAVTDSMTASGTFTLAEKSKRPAIFKTCAYSACSAISRP